MTDTQTNQDRGELISWIIDNAGHGLPRLDLGRDLAQYETAWLADFRASVEAHHVMIEEHRASIEAFEREQCDSFLHSDGYAEWVAAQEQDWADQRARDMAEWVRALIDDEDLLDADGDPVSEQDHAEAVRLLPLVKRARRHDPLAELTPEDREWVTHVAWIDDEGPDYGDSEY